MTAQSDFFRRVILPNVLNVVVDVLVDKLLLAVVKIPAGFRCAFSLTGKVGNENIKTRLGQERRKTLSRSGVKDPRILDAPVNQEYRYSFSVFRRKPMHAGLVSLKVGNH